MNPNVKCKGRWAREWATREGRGEGRAGLRMGSGSERPASISGSGSENPGDVPRQLGLPFFGGQLALRSVVSDKPGTGRRQGSV